MQINEVSFFGYLELKRLCMCGCGVVLIYELVKFAGVGGIDTVKRVVDGVAAAGEHGTRFEGFSVVDTQLGGASGDVDIHLRNLEGSGDVFLQGDGADQIDLADKFAAGFGEAQTKEFSVG